MYFISFHFFLALCRNPGKSSTQLITSSLWESGKLRVRCISSRRGAAEKTPLAVLRAAVALLRHYSSLAEAAVFTVVLARQKRRKAADLNLWSDAKTAQPLVFYYIILEQKLDWNSDIVHYLFTLFWISRTFVRATLSREKARGNSK